MKSTPGLIAAVFSALLCLANLGDLRAEGVVEKWSARYNGPDNSGDVPTAVAVDGAGNVAVTGYSYNAKGDTDYYTAKYAGTNGALLWEKRFNNTSTFGFSSDAAMAVAVDSAGNVIVGGSGYTAKYAAATGAVIWEKLPTLSSPFISAIVVDSAGNIIVAGQSSGNNGDLYTAKFAAANGALLWEKRYDTPGSGQDEALAVAVDSAGNVAVTGITAVAPDGHPDYLTVKYAGSNGALLWAKQYNGAGNHYDEAKSVAVDGAGNVIVTGRSYTTPVNSDFYTVKYGAADGTVLWEKYFDGPTHRNDVALDLAVDSAGNVIVTGGTETTYGDADFYTAKYAGADGAQLWERRFTGPVGKGTAQAVKVDGAGDVFITGNIEVLNPGSPDFYTAKYSGTNGALLWEKTYNGSANGFDRIESYKQFALTPDGGVVVTGYTAGINNPFDYITVKYLTVFAPVVTTGGASALTATSATLAATVNPKGADAALHFDYGKTTAYESSSANQNAGSGTTAVSVSAVLTGLEPRTLYHFRAVATNVAGTGTGEDATFTTGNTNPVAGTGNAIVTTGDTVMVTLPFTSPDADGDVVSISGTSGGAGLFTIGAVNGNQVAVSGALNTVGTATLSFTVKDDFGGTAGGSVEITVTDNDAPVLTLVGVNPAITEAGAPYHDAGATALDAVAGDLTAAIQTTGNLNTNVPGDYTLTYAVSDGLNTATATRTVRVVDTTPPTITHIPSPISVKADATNHAPVVDFTSDLTAIDNVGVTSVQQSPLVGTIVGYGPHIITLTVEDAAHNQATCTTTFIVDDGPALPGRYAGLLADAQGAFHALMELKLTPGQFLTGYLRLEDGRRLRLPGSIVPADTHAETLAIADGFSLELDFDGFGHVVATLTNGGTILTTNGVLANAFAPADVPGKYTAFLEQTPNAAPGWLYAVVSSRGAMRWSGMLPDGSPVLAHQGSIVDRHGDALIFLLGRKGANALLAGQVHFANLAESDFAGALTFNGAPCAVNGAMFTPAPSGLPAAAFPLALTGAGVNVASTVTLLPNNSATVLPPIKSFTPRSKPGLLSTGLFYLTFRTSAAPAVPLLKGNGIFHQKLGVGVGQFKAGAEIGRVQLGPLATGNR